MKPVIVRHGGTEWTLSGRYTGSTDLPLTPNGRRQAASLTASISVIEDYHGERCIGRWNVDAALLDRIGNRTASSENVAVA